tara:strand:+ start:1633 stop:2160 length:528 start_codon:yes stop_codon:yes gene_type:complete
MAPPSYRNVGLLALLGAAILGVGSLSTSMRTVTSWMFVHPSACTVQSDGRLKCSDFTLLLLSTLENSERIHMQTTESKGEVMTSILEHDPGASFFDADSNAYSLREVSAEGITFEGLPSSSAPGTVLTPLMQVRMPSCKVSSLYSDNQEPRCGCGTELAEVIGDCGEDSVYWTRA